MNISTALPGVPLRVLLPALLRAGPIRAEVSAAQLPGGETRSPEIPKPLFFQDVAWSPDASWIAFSGYAGSEREYEPRKWDV